MYGGMGGGWLDSLKDLGQNLLNGVIQSGGNQLLQQWGMAPQTPAAAAAPTAPAAPAGAPAPAQPSAIVSTAKSTWPILAVAGGAAALLGTVLYFRAKKS